MLPLTDVLAYICGIWSLTVFFVQGIGIYKLFRHYSTPPRKAVSASRGKENAPHITIIRPVKGIEPYLYECLASTFQQDYPVEKFAIHLCVESADDPAYPVLRQVVADHPQVDARIYVEAEDPVLHGPRGHVHNLGPNPKIRNMSRAYREAKGDIIWIVDCNVWVAKGVAGRMVDKLCGYVPGARGTAAAYKFVHQLPAVVDVSGPRTAGGGGGGGGGRLDEMFMATSHAKFYIAINTVGIAPCILGKSNMFRKSHLDALTDPARNPVLSPARDAARDAARGRGIDFFSSNICEDHLIGDLLWRSRVPGHRNHGLVLGDLAVQPIRDMSLAAYVGRRVRWLRVRKWTVTLATLVEPGVEPLLCSLYFAFAATTAPAARELLGLPPTWSAMLACWLAAVLTWMLVDWCVYSQLLAFRCVEADESTPAFARPTGRFGGGVARRSFGAWLAAWLGREALALPVWTWAVLLGTTVSWRGKSFYVRPDMTVVEIGSGEKAKSSDDDRPNGKATGRDAGLAKVRIE